MGLVIGGMLPSTEYTEQVEILAPGYNCKYRTIDNYPHKIVGVASGFTLGITVHKYNTEHIIWSSSDIHIIWSTEKHQHNAYITTFLITIKMDTLTLGQNIVCGGGMMEYIHCHKGPYTNYFDCGFWPHPFVDNFML